MMSLFMGVVFTYLTLFWLDGTYGPATLQEWAIIEWIPYLAAIGWLMSGLFGRWPAPILAIAYLGYVFLGIWPDGVWQGADDHVSFLEHPSTLSIEPMLAVGLAWGSLMGRGKGIVDVVTRSKKSGKGYSAVLK